MDYAKVALSALLALVAFIAVRYGYGLYASAAMSGGRVGPVIFFGTGQVSSSEMTCASLVTR
ncbi:MAG: hypothetical protein RLZZ416_609 [Candidatus Parcubacteria bacterium]|jgi:hypothetical protein